MRAEAEADYEWLFRAYFPRILRTVFLIVHNRAAAEELTQDAFLKLLQHWGKVSAYERPDAWVRRVAIRMAIRAASRESSRWVRERSTWQSAWSEMPEVQDPV